MNKFPILLATLLAINCPAGNYGWRCDGGGKFPETDPATTWSTGKNIIWETPLSSWGNASPVLAGNRIFVCAETDTLVCVNAADGRILWQKVNGYADVMTSSQTAQARDNEQKSEGTRKDLVLLLKEQDDLIRQRQTLQQALKDLTVKIKDNPADATLKQSQDEKQKQAAVLAQRLGEKDRTIRKLKQELIAFPEWFLPDTHAANGYSSPTPVSDGKNVYALFGTGVAACYDLDGNRKWIRLVEKPMHIQGHSASPVLCGNLVLVHVLGLNALNVATGETLWKTKSTPGFGTPLLTRIGNEPVILTCSGDLVCVKDGKVVGTNFCGVSFCAPVIQDGVVYSTNEKLAKATPLPTQLPATPVKGEPRWQAKLKAGRYYASPVVHDGLVYALCQDNTLTVLDAAKGDLVYEQKLPLGSGFCFPSLAVAGKYVFAGGDAGVTIVFKTGREYKEVAKNLLLEGSAAEKFRSSLIFSGKRMYLRGLANLYCIGE